MSAPYREDELRRRSSLQNLGAEAATRWWTTAIEAPQAADSLERTLDQLGGTEGIIGRGFLRQLQRLLEVPLQAEREERDRREEKHISAMAQARQRETERILEGGRGDGATG